MVTWKKNLGENWQYRQKRLSVRSEIAKGEMSPDGQDRICTFRVQESTDSWMEKAPTMREYKNQR